MSGGNFLDRSVHRRRWLFRAAMTVLAASLSHVALAQSVTPLTFEIPAAQGPGTPGFGIVSDPTIRPFQAPGVPATFSTTLPIDFQGNGRPDLLACYVAIPPHPRVKVPCRVLRPQPDGSVTDITRQIFGTGALPSMEAPREIVVGDFNGGFFCLADFNGDGWEDFYCSIGPVEVANRYRMSNGDGTWNPVAPNVLSPGSGFGIHAVDFDGDGRPDLLQVAHTQTGDIAYKSFLNRTPRTVPSEPLIGTAIAGNAQASIFFTAPLGSGMFPITGYTATCSPGTFTGVVTGTGTGSPITVPGLTPGRRYACSVTATNAAGTSLPSGAVTVRPTGPPRRRAVRRT